MSQHYVIGLGANLGDRAAALAFAVRSLEALATSSAGEVLAVSSLYETEAVGPPQPAYLNAAVWLRCGLGAQELLARVLDVEREAGRLRRERWGPRVLDLDILWAERLTVDLPGLRIPHAHLTERAFAVVPLVEVVPLAADPSTGTPYAALPVARTGDIARVAGVGWERLGSSPDRV